MLTAKRVVGPASHKKRHGAHHHKSKSYHRVYWPYIPLALSIAASIVLSNIRPAATTQDVLAYATNMSVSGLLESTNSQRVANGQAALSLNNQLISAAQAKADDMVSRNYWSHNTPDGKEPWIFFDSAGYKYLKAGENLAYGFLTSDATVNGWMNSPSHKANLLDAAFVEVGFGFANSANYQDTGNETIVVAMYGKPQTLAAQANTTPPASQTAPKPKPSPAPSPTPIATPAPIEVKTEPATSDSPVVATAPQPIKRVQTLPGGSMPWVTFSVGLLSGLAVMFMLLKHSLGLRHFLGGAGHIRLHHTMLDSLLLSLAILGFTLTRSVGFVL